VCDNTHSVSSDFALERSVAFYSIVRRPHIRCAARSCAGINQSCPRVGLTHGLGWAGSGRIGSIFFSFGGLCWVGSTVAKVLERIMLIHLKHG